MLEIENSRVNDQLELEDALSDEIDKNSENDISLFKKKIDLLSKELADVTKERDDLQLTNNSLDKIESNFFLFFGKKINSKYAIIFSKYYLLFLICI